MYDWERRFWRKIRRGEPGDCWPWTGANNGNGYGRLKLAGHLVLAHRLAYLLTKGDLPEDGRYSYHGTVVRHSCDNPCCCNPAHLIAGTQGDNVRDMFEKGREAIPAPLGNGARPECVQFGPDSFRALPTALSRDYGDE